MTLRSLLSVCILDSMQTRAVQIGFAAYDPQFPGRQRRPRRDLDGKIYVLLDPRDKTVRYVGQTLSAPKRRREHQSGEPGGNRLMDMWKRELRLIGMAPTFLVVDSCRIEDLDALEKAWIAYYRRVGRLYNVHEGGRLDGCTPPLPSPPKLPAKRKKVKPAKLAMSGREVSDAVAMAIDLLSSGVSPINAIARSSERCAAHPDAIAKMLGLTKQEICA